MTKKFLSLIFSIFLFASLANAQTAEVTVSFNEQFFDSLLDAIFKNLKQPDFPLATNSPKSKVESSKSFALSFNDESAANANRKSQIANPRCNEVIRLQREVNGVRTAVRFRDGQIYAPLAFSGSYNPPLIGCVDFQGHAETNIELAFDQGKQALIGTVKVLNVQLGSVANLAGGVLARFVQNSIDKKINPIEILRAEKLSFVIPIQNSDGALRLRATGMRHEIGNGVLNVHVGFEFLKAD
jgi:hypothetical protein